MGAELGARAISHLEKISEAGIQAMSQAGSIGVVLPTTAYILRLTPPPVRDMIDAGMAVALGSDFNPNAHCFAMVSMGFDAPLYYPQLFSIERRRVHFHNAEQQNED